MNRTIRILLPAALLSALILSGGCSGRPSGVLDKEDMARLLADIHTGEAVIESSSRSFPSDSSKRAFLQAIYAAHGVTREQVDSSYSWYGYNMDRYMEVYDRTVEILEQRLEKAQDIAGASAEGAVELTVNLQGDSVDVWPGMRWRRFTSNMPNDHITFLLSTDNNWERGDVYTLRSKIIDNSGPIVYTIAAEYTDGKYDYITSSQPGDGWHDIQFALDSARSARRVYGIISYTPRKGENAYIDSITLYRTRWGGHYREARNAVTPFENRTRRHGSDSKPPMLTVEDAPAVSPSLERRQMPTAIDKAVPPAPPHKIEKLSEKAKRTPVARPGRTP